MTMPWKQLSSKEVYRTKWMWVTADEVETENGQRFTYSVVHKKPFAMVVPWDGERFTLVGLYRYPVGQTSWEFPAGHFEHETIEDTAKAELREEAGLEAAKLEEIGSTWIGPGSIDQEGKLFLATGLTPVERDLDAGEEGMQVKQVTSDELMEMIKVGLVKDGPTLASVTLLKIKGII